MEPTPCPSCDDGTIRPVKQYRLGDFWVFLGHLCLSASFVTLALVVGMLAVSWAAMNRALTTEQRRELTAAGVPEEIQAKLDRRESLSDDERRALTPDQKKAVEKCQGIRNAWAQLGICVLIFGWVGAQVLAPIAVLGLLTGWLLVRRKRVLVCDRCRSVAG